MMMVSLVGMPGSLAELLEEVPFGSWAGIAHHWLPFCPGAVDAVIDFPCVERSFGLEVGRQSPPDHHLHLQDTRSGSQQMYEAESFWLMLDRLDQTPQETMDLTVPLARRVKSRGASHSCPGGKT